MKENDVLIYENENGEIIVDAVFKDETMWMTQKGLANIFDVDRTVVTKHLKNIFDTEELDKEVVCAKIAHTTQHGAIKGKTQTTYVSMYNLDAIIAVGYRINSKKATQFRIWATKILKEYITKGFVLNDDRFVKGNKYDSAYFEELLERVRTIRISERMSYQKIIDIFEETSADYNPNTQEAYTFLKIVQNKLHYAVTGHTAAELIYERVNADKEHMGLTNWKNSPNGRIYKYDVGIAKNYLNEDEIKKLNRITIAFLDYAEDMAEERKIMTMQDWINITDRLLEFRDKKVLTNAGKVSHKQAISKAETEYEKFRIIQDKHFLSTLEEKYIKTLDVSTLNSDGN